MHDQPFPVGSLLPLVQLSVTPTFAEVAAEQKQAERLFPFETRMTWRQAAVDLAQHSVSRVWVASSELYRWTTAVNIKLLLPLRRSSGGLVLVRERRLSATGRSASGPSWKDP